MAKAQYNSMLHSYLVDQYGSSSLNDYFTDKIEQTDKNPATPINTLNMKRVYFLVSDNTASASELLINGLRPLMDVKVIGINTNGKYTGSTTIKDYDESGNVNPNHKWAMQPIIVKYTNSIGVSDYIDGLDPDIRAEEDFAALLPFGDPNEDLLKIALAHIKGLPVTGMTLKSAKMGLKKVADSKSFKRFANEMFVDPGKFQ
jgi:C-terminal processing protease CtpA/Prc